MLRFLKWLCLHSNTGWAEHFSFLDFQLKFFFEPFISKSCCFASIDLKPNLMNIISNALGFQVSYLFPFLVPLNSQTRNQFNSSVAVSFLFLLTCCPTTLRNESTGKALKTGCLLRQCNSAAGPQYRTVVMALC